MFTGKFDRYLAEKNIRRAIISINILWFVKGHLDDIFIRYPIHNSHGVPKV